MLLRFGFGKGPICSGVMVSVAVTCDSLAFLGWPVSEAEASMGRSVTKLEANSSSVNAFRLNG